MLRVTSKSQPEWRRDFGFKFGPAMPPKRKRAFTGYANLWSSRKEKLAAYRDAVEEVENGLLVRNTLTLMHKNNQFT
jgi:hypothetical protein